MPILFAIFILMFVQSTHTAAQMKWQQVDDLFQPLPASVHVYRSVDSLDGKPCIAYYVEADLRDRKLEFTVDTSLRRRLKPSEYFEKNNRALLVVNTTFFSFATHQNLNVVIRDKKLLGFNIHTINGRGKDTFTYRHPLGSAIGISKNRKADIAWLYTDSSLRYAYAYQAPVPAVRDSSIHFSKEAALWAIRESWPPKVRVRLNFGPWKMKTAVGGGPVLIQNGEIRITNNEEIKFAGKAIDDKHPRTAMGYTKDNKLIILVIEGRHPGKAEGASLTQEAQILKDLGCWEALNLDGGGSSCMLVNGKETIRVSDAGGQRPVPAVFMIRAK